MKTHLSKKVAIIGAGPAGLMAAEILARSGYSVTVYDRMPTPARKFLIAGRGGLNLTHSEPLESFISRYGKAASWLAPYIEAFTPTELRSWCEGLGVETFIGSSGRVFPSHMKAVELLRAWLKRLEEYGVEYRPRHIWLGWEGDQLKFQNAEQDIILVKTDAALLALGGASWPHLGSDGAWVRFFDKSEVVSLAPSNCGFVVPWSDYFSQRFAGEPLKPVTVTHEGVSRQGEAMITEKGIEGGVIYALSTSIREAIGANGKAIITLDLRPNMAVEALANKLTSKNRGSKSFSTHLKNLGFSPLIIALLHETTASEVLSKAGAQDLAQLMKVLPIELTATAGIKRAISSAGGVKRDAVNDDLMLREKPGVFVAGEMLDWEAPTGGYLLQGCFSTAAHAAKGIIQYLR